MLITYIKPTRRTVKPLEYQSFQTQISLSGFRYIATFEIVWEIKSSRSLNDSAKPEPWHGYSGMTTIFSHHCWLCSNKRSEGEKGVFSRRWARHKPPVDQLPWVLVEKHATLCRTKPVVHNMHILEPLWRKKQNSPWCDDVSTRLGLATGSQDLACAVTLLRYAGMGCCDWPSKKKTLVRGVCLGRMTLMERWWTKGTVIFFAPPRSVYGTLP